MSFAGRAWKLLVGIKDGLVLIFMLLFFALLFAMLSASPYQSSSSGDRALRLNLNGIIVEETSYVDPLAILTSQQAPVNEFRQRDIIRAIDGAAEDEDIKALVLDLDSFFGGGQTSLAAVGEALERFKKSEKPIYSFATAYGDDGYQLAAHATDIWVDPMGGIFFTGRGGSRLYYKTLLDKLGVTAHIYRVGTYKSAVEPYMLSNQSVEAKQANQALADTLWSQWQEEVSAARPAAKLANYVNDPAGTLEQSGVDMAELAAKLNLVDNVGSRAAFEKKVAEIAGENDNDDVSDLAYQAQGLQDWVYSNPAETDGSPIAVITVAGEIVDGNAGPGVAAGGRIADQIKQALKNDDLKAMVLRVDSPGGSVLASEEIRVALLGVKEKKLPLIISMSNLAASGGYWVATPGDYIFAEPSTITGSIGVFGMLPSFEKALAKLGVNADGVSTTPLSGQPDVLGGVDTQFNRIAQTGVENTYAKFLKLVSEARGKTPAEIDKIAQGRVWDGGTAKQLGLIDGFGSLDDALAEAAKRADLSEGEYYAEYFEQQPSFSSTLLGGFLGANSEQQADMPRQDLFSRAAASRQQVLDSALHSAQSLVSGSNMQAKCLECEAYAPAKPASKLSSENMLFKLLGWFK